jgi:hypothetical protein
MSALKEFDIIVDRYEADRYIPSYRDANKIIFKPILDRFMQYLKTFERLVYSMAKMESM